MARQDRSRMQTSTRQASTAKYNSCPDLVQRLDLNIMQYGKVDYYSVLIGQLWWHALQAGAATGLIAAFVEGPIDFYKSQIQVQIIRSRADPNYKRESICCDTAYSNAHANMDCHSVFLNARQCTRLEALASPCTSHFTTCRHIQ